jgi:hypothetical protein
LSSTRLMSCSTAHRIKTSKTSDISNESSDIWN